jgi:hypothetical protein
MYLVEPLVLSLTEKVREGWSEVREIIFLNLTIGQPGVDYVEHLESIANRVAKIPEDKLTTITMDEFKLIEE